MTEISIIGTPPSIGTTAFSDLAVDILNDLVHGDASPLKDAIVVMDEYLANAVDLDATQKAGMFADFLKDSYVAINQQAINASIDILKSNAQLELDTYKVEADYNVAVKQEAKVAAEVTLLADQEAKVVSEELLIKEQILMQRTGYLEAIAKLYKQYGFSSATYGNHTGTVASLGASSDDGALDKQIVGYDKVNYKDALKSVNELITLLSNAGSETPTWMGDASKALLELTTDGKLSMFNYDADGGDDPATSEDESVSPGYYTRAKVDTTSPAADYNSTLTEV